MVLVHGTAATSDFEPFHPIEFSNTAWIRLFTANDEVTLEYDDKVQLNFTSDNPGIIIGLETLGEYIRDTATINIIDNDCKCLYILCVVLAAFLFFTVLMINFGELDYSTDESSSILSPPITLQFRTNQNPFTVVLSSVTVDSAESMGLGFFINSETIPQGYRATARM